MHSSDNYGFKWSKQYVASSLFLISDPLTFCLDKWVIIIKIKILTRFIQVILGYNSYVFTTRKHRIEVNNRNILHSETKE